MSKPSRARPKRKKPATPEKGSPRVTSPEANAPVEPGPDTESVSAPSAAPEPEPVAEDVRVPGGEPCIAVHVDDGAGRNIVLSVPLVRDIPLSRVAGINAVGVYSVTLQTPRGVAQAQVPVELDVDPSSTMYDAAVEALRQYDDHKQEAEDSGKADLYEKMRPHVQPAGQMPRRIIQ